MLRNPFPALFEQCPRDSQAVSFVGGQRGDEGKLKGVLLACEESDIVGRYNGGRDCGHTGVDEDGKKTVSHQLPCAASTRDDLWRISGRGTLIEPVGYLEELVDFRNRQPHHHGRISIDAAAVLTFVDHILTDRRKYRTPGQIAAGQHLSTGWGIAPTSADKALRLAIPIGDAVDMTRPELLAALAGIRGRNPWIGECTPEQLQAMLDHTPFTGEMVLDLEALANYYFKVLQTIRDHGVRIHDCVGELLDALDHGRRLALEGAQGHDLGIHTGVYPHTASSDGTRAGIFPGLGIGTERVPISVLMYKAPYYTSVGRYDGPGEITDPNIADRIREVGEEFGATTGFPRREFWFNVPQARLALREGRASQTIIVLNKMDVVGTAGLNNVRVLSNYVGNGASTNPNASHAVTARALSRLTPIYEDHLGWGDIRGYRDAEDLPTPLRNYVDRVLHLMGAHNLPVWIGNGPKAKDFIIYR